MPADIAATSVVSSDATLADDVVVGDFSVVHPGVDLGAGTRIGAFCEVGSASGDSLVIGAGSLVRAYTNVQGGSTYGPGLQTGQYTMLRPGMTVGPNLQVGSNCELQGESTIGAYVRIQSGVHLGKHTTIGDLVWIFPNVLTVNDPLPPSEVHLGVTFEPLSMVAANALLMPGVVIGEGAFVGAASVVRESVRPIACVGGDPATEFTTVDRFVDLTHRLSHPWPKHFRRGYPPEAETCIDGALARVEDLIGEERERRRANRR